MDDLYRELLDYLRGMWHRRWIGLAAAGSQRSSASRSSIAFRRSTRRARASTSTRESLLRPLLAGPRDPAQSGPAGRADEPHADQPAQRRKAGAHGRPRSPRHARSRARRTDRQRDEDDFSSPATSTPTSTSSPTAIPIRSRRRRSCSRCSTIFVESSLGDKRQDTQTAVKFLDDQIKHYEETCSAAENRLKEFKLKYLGVADREGPDYFGRIAKLQTTIEDARLELQCGGAVARFIQAGARGRVADCSCSTAPEPRPARSRARNRRADRQAAKASSTTFGAGIPTSIRTCRHAAPDRAARGAESGRYWTRAGVRRRRRGVRRSRRSIAIRCSSRLRISLCRCRGHFASRTREARGLRGAIQRRSRRRRSSCRRSKPSSRSSTATTTCRRRPTNRCSPGANPPRWARTCRTPAAPGFASSIRRACRPSP